MPFAMKGEFQSYIVQSLGVKNDEMLLLCTFADDKNYCIKVLTCSIINQV